MSSTFKCSIPLKGHPAVVLMTASRPHCSQSPPSSFGLHTPVSDE
uniref:Uncharacterized protein n=1 Tax=Arundo donax TaxID=35708 RepID=A0A0A9KZ80_ARUDO